MTLINEILKKSLLNIGNAHTVLGGPCICYAKGNPERLSIQDLIDSFVPVLASAHLGCPASLYFQSYESVMMAGFLHYVPEQADHLTMRRYLEAGIHALTSLLGIQAPAIHWLDTSEPYIRQIIDEILPSITTEFPPDRLWGLYGQKPEATYPKGTPEETLMLEVYCRNVALYSPAFMERALGILPEQVLFLENTTQEKAARLCYLSAQHQASFLFYPPPPNVQGKEMCMGNKNHTIELRHTQAQIEHRANKLDVLPYYQDLFQGVSIADVMAAWKQRVGTV